MTTSDEIKQAAGEAAEGFQFQPLNYDRMEADLAQIECSMAIAYLVQIYQITIAQAAHILENILDHDDEDLSTIVRKLTAC